MKEDEMSMICSTHGKMKCAYKLSILKSEGRCNLGVLMYTGMILKCVS
jgi:hypothetical protein